MDLSEEGKNKLIDSQILNLSDLKISLNKILINILQTGKKSYIKDDTILEKILTSFEKLVKYEIENFDVSRIRTHFYF